MVKYNGRPAPSIPAIKAELRGSQECEAQGLVARGQACCAGFETFDVQKKSPGIFASQDTAAAALIEVRR